MIFSTSLSKELFQKLEDQRGLVPRSTYIEFILKEFFKKLIEEQNDTFKD